MSTRLQLWCVWSGPIFVISYLIALWGIAGFVPPPSPTTGAAEVSAFYEQHRNAIRAGQLLCIVLSALLIPWFSVISVQMARIEGRFPILACMQLAGGTVLVVFFILPSLLWSAAAFRPDRDPQLVLLINDIGWLDFVLIYPTYTLQLTTLAIAGFMDKSHVPIFPRWACYFNLWVGVSAIGGGFATFFKTGPFAWNGIFAFWLPIGVFAIWIGVMFVLMRNGIMRQGDPTPELSAS